jgi:ABC-type transporter Mla subunit MlaD
VAENDKELEYYRQIEDLFAAMRGCSHILSPKDFQLMRTWWRDGVSITAVTAGLAEIFHRLREDRENVVVVSLSYCRHAIERHAHRLKEAAVGGSTEGNRQLDDPAEVARRIAALSSDLNTRSSALAAGEPEIANVIEQIGDQVARLAQASAPDLEERLFALEEILLANCHEAASNKLREQIEKQARLLAVKSGATGESLERTFRAMLDRELRNALDLPRLEVG